MLPYVFVYIGYALAVGLAIWLAFDAAWLEIVFVVKTDYSPGQARGGSDDCILSTSVHHKGFGMKLSVRASSLYVQAIPKDCRIIGRFSYCFQHEEGIVNPTCCLCYAALNSIPLFSIGVFAANMQPLI